MTEYQCRALIDGDKFELLTVGCHTLTQAHLRFDLYCHEMGGQLDLADCVSYEKIEVDDGE